jgi:nucleotide-binding universal stress UspA family protein
VYKHILIATDGSQFASKAVTQGLALAKALGAKATAITVTEPWATLAAWEVRERPPAQDYDSWAAAHAEELFTAVHEAANKINVVCSTAHMIGVPADSILEFANRSGCDLIVMASHGRRGLSKVLLGSVTAEVLTGSPGPVLVCR